MCIMTRMRLWLAEPRVHCGKNRVKNVRAWFAEDSQRLEQRKRVREHCSLDQALRNVVMKERRTDHFGKVRLGKQIIIEHTCVDQVRNGFGQEGVTDAVMPKRDAFIYATSKEPNDFSVAEKK